MMHSWLGSCGLCSHRLGTRQAYVIVWSRGMLEIHKEHAVGSICVLPSLCAWAHFIAKKLTPHLFCCIIFDNFVIVCNGFSSYLVHYTCIGPHASGSSMCCWNGGSIDCSSFLEAYVVVLFGWNY